MTSNTVLNQIALSIEHSQRVQIAADGTATRGYETYIKKYVGMIESGLLARLSGNANKLLDALGLRARILADPRRPQAEEEFQMLKSLGIVADQDRGELFCFASLERLARDTGLASLHTVEAGLEQLIALGIVRKVSAKGQRRRASGRFGSNFYFIQPASFIGKFDAEPVASQNDECDRWQKLPTVTPTFGNSPITVDCQIKKKQEQQDKEGEIPFVIAHFGRTIGAERFEPNERETRRLAALLAEGYSVEEICIAIQRVVAREQAKGKTVRSLAYCLPAVKDRRSRSHSSRGREAEPEVEREAVSGAPQPSAVQGLPPAEIPAENRAVTSTPLEQLAAGDAELRDLLELVQERNPGHRLQKSDVRAWQAVADRFRGLAIARDTTPIGLVMQAVLKAIGAYSDRDGFFAPALAEAILENWEREQGAGQSARTADTPTAESNGQGRAVIRSTKTLPALQTVDGLLDPAQVWDTARKELQGQMTKATFDTWVKPTFVAEARDGEKPMLVIGTHNPYAVEWLEHRLHTTIQRTVCGIVGKNVTVKYISL